MADPMELASSHKLLNPSESYESEEERFQLQETTLYYHFKGTHHAAGINTPRALSIKQEHVLVNTISLYASRGTFLTPSHVHELAEALAEQNLGVNWVGRFVQRYKDVIHSSFFLYQEAARLKADMPETRRAFYTLVGDQWKFMLILEMKSVYDTGLYPPSCIYNMDETLFSIGLSQNSCKIAPSTLPSKAIASPASNQHITVLACIGVKRAAIPPIILFQGVNVQLSWNAVMEPHVPQLAEVTDSGWTNSYMMKKWLETVFDPYMQDVPAAMRRLLIMDGHNTHVQVNSLDSCWARGFDCVILPANMTSIFQPLDVAFFNQLKSAYHSKVQSHLLNSKSTLLSKGLFLEVASASMKGDGFQQEYMACMEEIRSVAA